MTSDGWAPTPRRPALAIGLAAAALLVAALCLAPLPVSDLPSRSDRRSIVDVLAPGVDASDLDTKVVQPIEAALSRLASVRHVSSLTGEGQSAIEVEIRRGPDGIGTLGAVRAAVEHVTRDLAPPCDVLVRTIDRAASPLVTYAVAWPGRTPGEVAALLDDDVITAIRRIDGVGRIDRSGGATRETLVSLQAERLEALSVTAVEVGRQWRAALADAAGSSAAESVEAIGAIAIRLPGGGSVRLDDLATLREVEVPERSFAQLDGEPVVGLDIYADTTRGDVAVAEDVAAFMARIGTAHPDMVLTRIASRGDTAALRLRIVCASLGTLLCAAAVGLAVMMRDWRAAAAAAVAIGVPFAATALFLPILGIPLDAASLAALVVATGIVAGDAIDAATDRSAKGDSLAGAAAACGALPFCLLDDALLGRWPIEFGLVLVVAVVSAWLTRRVFLPATGAPSLAASADDSAGDQISLGVMRLLEWTLRHGRAVAALGMLGLTLAVAGARLLPPGAGLSVDRSSLALALPPGASLTAMADAVAEAAPTPKRRTDVPDLYAIGVESTGGAELSVTRRGSAIVPDLDDQPDLRAARLDQFGQRDISFQVIGREAATVDRVADRLAEQMRALPLLDHVATSTTAARAAFRIRADPDRAARLGVDPSAVEDTIRLATVGVSRPGAIASSTLDGPSPVRMRIGSQTVDWLGLLRVPGPAGAMVPLGSVARLGVGPSAGPIRRRDGESAVTLGADIRPAESRAAARAAVAALPGFSDLPPGVRVLPAGDPEHVKRLLRRLRRTAAASVVLIGFVLLLGFGHPVPALSSLSILPAPLAGAVLALLAARLPIGMAVLPGLGLSIGFMLQQAVAFNLVAAQAIQHGTPAKAAIMEASRRRALPFLVTALALAAGLLPLALTPEASSLAPAAVSALGSLVAATLAGMIGVPVAFLTMDEGARALRHLGWTRSGRADRPQGPVRVGR